VFSSGFSEEPEYSGMGLLDFIVLDSLGAYREGTQAEFRRGSPLEPAILTFMKLSRKERFAAMREAMPRLWPFRPRSVWVETRTTTRGEKSGSGRVEAVKPPNLVTISALVDELDLEGEVRVTTCK
jgi:hypothetical protein